MKKQGILNFLALAVTSLLGSALASVRYMAKAEAEGTELSRKITIKTVTGGAEKWFESLMKSESKEMELMDVFGYANGAKAGTSEYGEFIRLTGTFRAVNRIDGSGEITNAPAVILPTHIGEAMKAALEAPERAGPLQFAFRIGVRYDVNMATKYVYTIRDMLPPEQNDPLNALAQKLGHSKAPALTNEAAASTASTSTKKK